jgi:urea transport system substrate-binding protein
MKKKSRVAVIGLLITTATWISCRPGTSPDENGSTEREPIRVGVLHSLSGTMEISEKSVADATLLAIDDINDRGGLLGRKVEPVVADGESDWPTFAREAERLITQEKVSAVFGCWTSASRKTVKPVFETQDHLLFYPVQYEGLEQSPNIVYTGAAPNQQIIPAVRWCFENLGRKFFLVGSDYVFPRTANEIIRDQLRSLHGEIVGEQYILLGGQDVQSVVQSIVAARPDAILNTINGDTNVAFFRELRAAGITPEETPTMSFSIAEDELRMLGLEAMVGDYASWNYFQSVDREENERFVKRFQAKYGSHRVTDDPMEAAYTAVHLWAQAVREAGTDDVRAVRKAVANQRFEAPGGIVYVDPRNNHLWKTARIGRVMENGQFSIVWTSERPVRPDPYPGYRTEPEWQSFLDGLYTGWGESWANPGM